MYTFTDVRLNFILTLDCKSLDCVTHQKSCQKRTKCKSTELKKEKAAEAEEVADEGGVDEDVVAVVVDPRLVTIAAK